MEYIITVKAKHPIKDDSYSTFTAKWEFLIEVDEDKEEFTRTTCHNEYGIPNSEKLILVKDFCLLRSNVHEETPDYVNYFEQGWGCDMAISFIYFEDVELITSFPKPLSEDHPQSISSSKEGE